MPLAPAPDHAALAAPRPGAAHVARGCARCGRPLTALQRFRGELCDGIDCRRLAVDAARRAAREAALASWRDEAAHATGDAALAAAPVVWLQHHDDGLAAPHADDLARLRAGLHALREAEVGPPLPGRGVDRDDAAAPGVGGRLCAACRGRCCRLGLAGQAFLRADDLRAWLAAGADRRWDDAVDHWLSHVGPAHLADSCLFHGPRGCTLPRDRRSEVCNGHACDTLQQVHRLEDDAADVTLVVGVVRAHALVGAHVVSAAGVRSLGAPAQVP